MSIGVPSGAGWVHTRPPTRSRASSTITDAPACRTRRAVVNPAYPAPTTQTSASTPSTLSVGQYPEPLFAVVAGVVVAPPLLPLLPLAFTTFHVPPKLVMPSPLVSPAAASMANVYTGAPLTVT